MRLDPLFACDTTLVSPGSACEPVADAELLEAAPAHLARFLARLPSGKASRLFVLTDSDADGLPAAALLVRALLAAGYSSVRAEARRKAESAWTPAVLDRIRPCAPEALFVLDLGSRPTALLADVPTLLIDHHAPLGVPPEATLVTGYGVEPTPTTGLLAYWAIAGLVPEETRAPWLWLAAISLLSDLGEKAPFDELRKARKQWSLKTLREATALLNAPRRSAKGDAQSALALLLRANSPAEILSGEHPESAELFRAREEVGAALALAKKAPPRFSRKFRDELGGDLVAVRMDTPCQVHPASSPGVARALPHQHHHGSQHRVSAGLGAFQRARSQVRKPDPLSARARATGCR